MSGWVDKWINGWMVTLLFVLEVFRMTLAAFIYYLDKSSY